MHLFYVSSVTNTHYYDFMELCIVNEAYSYIMINADFNEATAIKEVDLIRFPIGK